jgi:hypothetical protein
MMMVVMTMVTMMMMMMNWDVSLTSPYQPEVDRESWEVAKKEIDRGARVVFARVQHDRTFNLPFQVRVPVQPVFVEAKQPAGELVVDAALADGGLDIGAHLAE